MVLTLLHLFILCLVHSLSERRTGRIYCFIHINGFHFKFRCAPGELLLGFLLAFNVYIHTIYMYMYVCMRLQFQMLLFSLLSERTHMHTLQIVPCFLGICDDRKTSREKENERQEWGEGETGSGNSRQFHALPQKRTFFNFLNFS